MRKSDDERHPKLGKGYKSCGARTRAGQRCTQPAGFGTDHPGFGQCKYHGGANVVGDRIAAREEVEQVNQVLRLSGLRRMNPGDALMEELSRAAGAVAYFDAVVAGYTPEQLLSPVAQVHVDMWMEQRAAYVKTAALAARAGIEERQIQIQEQSAQAMVAALMAVLTKLELAPEQVQAARIEMATQLRALAPAS